MNISTRAGGHSQQLGAIKKRRPLAQPAPGNRSWRTVALLPGQVRVTVRPWHRQGGRRYPMILLTVPERALSSPSVSVAVMAKYHVPPDRLPISALVTLPLMISVRSSVVADWP
jgi:hypothetical protein